MKQILQNIQTKLAEIPELKYIDENWGQLDYYSQNMPVKWPCCLIDISDVNYSNIGVDRGAVPQNRQMGKIVVTLTIANIKLTNTSRQAPQTQKNQAWFIWDLAQKIHQKIHGFAPDVNASKMLREQLKRSLRDDGVQQYIIKYKLEVTNV